jgi:hypothetical protein
MKDRLGLLLQNPGNHRLGDAIPDRGHAQNSDAPFLGDLHRTHRGWKIGAGGHAVPDPVKVVLQILLEDFHRHRVHARCALVRLDFLVRLPDGLLGNIERLA